MRLRMVFHVKRFKKMNPLVVADLLFAVFVFFAVWFIAFVVINSWLSKP